MSGKTATIAKMALLLCTTAMPAFAQTSSSTYIDNLVRSESGGRYGVANNGLSSSLGGGQILFGTARGAGLVGGTITAGTGINAWQGAQWNTPWAQQWGITNTQQYLANIPAQQDAIGRVAAMNYRSLGNTSNLIGRNVNGVVMNDATLMECAYVLGGGGCRSYVMDPTGPFAAQARSNHIDRRMAGAANLDVSGITGRPGQAGGGTAVNPQTGQAQTPMTPTIAGLYCDPTILQNIQTLGAQEVDRRMALAMDPRTGYSTLNGGGVLAAMGIGSAGGAGGAGGLGGPMGSQGGFMGMSCIDRILNSSLNGIGNIFQLPSWSQIQSMLTSAATNFVCSQANRMFAQVTQPLNQALYRNLNVDGFLPGAGQYLSMAGLPSNVSLGGSLAITQGPSGGFVPLSERLRINGQMGTGATTGFSAPSKLFGP